MAGARTRPTCSTRPSSRVRGPPPSLPSGHTRAPHAAGPAFCMHAPQPPHAPPPTTSLACGSAASNQRPPKAYPANCLGPCGPMAAARLPTPVAPRLPPTLAHALPAPGLFAVARRFFLLFQLHANYSNAPSASRTLGQARAACALPGRAAPPRLAPPARSRATPAIRPPHLAPLPPTHAPSSCAPPRPRLPLPRPHRLTYPAGIPPSALPR